MLTGLLRQGPAHRSRRAGYNLKFGVFKRVLGLCEPQPISFPIEINNGHGFLSGTTLMTILNY